MNCYRTNCKCDDVKKMHCIHRLTEEQQRVIAKIVRKKKNNCMLCGEKTLKSKYMGQATRLCTSCGIVTQGGEIVRACLVNSRRVS